LTTGLAGKNGCSPTAPTTPNAIASSYANAASRARPPQHSARLRPRQRPLGRRTIRGEARNCGRQWCDAVRPTWGRAIAEVLRTRRSMRTATSTALRRRFSRSRSPARHGLAGGIPQGVPTARPCRARGRSVAGVRPVIERRERDLWTARKRATLNMERTEAIRKLQKTGERRSTRLA